MRKAAAMGAAAMVAATALGIAAPARAQGCPGGVPPLASTGTVSLEDGQIRIDPNAPAGDVENLDDLAAALQSCAVEAVPPAVWCLFTEFVREPVYELRFDKWVSQDPDTGEIVIDYGQVQSDLIGCV